MSKLAFTPADDVAGVFFANTSTSHEGDAGGGGGGVSVCSRGNTACVLSPKFFTANTSILIAPATGNVFLRVGSKYIDKIS